MLNKINNRGIAFTFDAIFSIIIILIILFSTSFIVFNNTNQNIEQNKQFILEQKTISLIDAITKNNNQNSFLGLAVIDIDKKRVLSNKISLNNLNFIELKLNNFFVKEIRYQTKNNFKKTIFSSNKKFSTCFSIERFVLIENEKSLLTLVGCYE